MLTLYAVLGLVLLATGVVAWDAVRRERRRRWMERRFYR